MARDKLFPLEKILTISIEDFFRFSKYEPKSYDLVGIHISDVYSSSSTTLSPIGVPKPILTFSKAIPDGVSFVVNYTSGVHGFTNADGDNTYVFVASGTGLRLKS